MTAIVTSVPVRVPSKSQGEASANSHPAITAAHALSERAAPPAMAPSSPAEAPPLLLDVHATARALGVPPKIVGNWNRAGRLPIPVRMGRRSLFWRADELADWVRRDCPPRQRWETMKGGRR